MSGSFPVTAPAPGATDARFSFGLLADVVKVLEAHGYPQPSGPDLVDLQQALFRFIYEEHAAAPKLSTAVIQSISQREFKSETARREREESAK